MNDDYAAAESLDRASPDLWPDHLPGLNEFAALSQNENGTDDRLDDEQFATLIKLASLSPEELMVHIKDLHNVAYELGIEERKEMTRGKYLNILGYADN